MKKLIVSCVVMLAIAIPVVSASADSGYIVKAGDTLFKIATKHNISLQSLIKANPTIKNPDIINVNQSINIPSGTNNSTNTNKVVHTASEYEMKVIDLTNKERAKKGLSALKYDWELSRVARHKSMDMQERKYFSHNSPIYGSPFDMMKSYMINYKSAGENIAQGYKTPEEVVKGWMNSSGHRANILNKNFTHIGVGYVEKGNYWTQQFIGK